MGTAGYYVFSRAVAGGEHVIVPNVVYTPITKAQFLLAEESLMIGKQTYYYTEEVPEYHVISQRPAAGEVVRAGRKVYLTVSSGRGEIEAPALVGRNLQDARTEIASSRLMAGTEARVPHDLPIDTVIAQEPLPKRVVNVGTEIHMLISSGPSSKNLIMPDITGASVQKMAELLAHLNVTFAPRIVNTGERIDAALSQFPPAGTLVQKGQQVIYEVFPSGNIDIPGAETLRRVNAYYIVPESLVEHEIRVDILDKDGQRQTVAEPAMYKSGSRIAYNKLTSEDISIEFYLDGQKVRTFKYKKGEDAPEVIYDNEISMPDIDTETTTDTEGEDSATFDNITFDTFL